MCQLDDDDFMECREVKLRSVSMLDDLKVNTSFSFSFMIVFY